MGRLVIGIGQLEKQVNHPQQNAISDLYSLFLLSEPKFGGVVG